MCRTVLLGFALVCALAGSAHAVPVECTSMNTLDQFISQNAGGGCFVQDKLFTDFSYSGGGSVTASDVDVATAFGIGTDIHGFTLTPEPGSSRTQEVRIAQQILQAMDIRPFLPQVTACPGCGRTTSSYFQELSQQVEKFLHARMPEWKRTKPQAASLQVAVMGCVVNGPGESKAAHIGISLPGTGEAPRAPVYVDGEKVATLEGPTLAKDFAAIVESYVARM